ncbi:MAG: hypothetical protein PHV51_08225, partial [Methanosarcinaceae archaeon]|nr:hypothetical protein [Methanosarcinaceae archaeon]
CLEGSMKMNAKARYVKKDGTVSEYPTAPILQYHGVRAFRPLPGLEGRKTRTRNSPETALKRRPGQSSQKTGDLTDEN